MNEKDLQILILDALHTCGISAWLTHKIGAYKHLPIIPGISDIIGVLPGGQFLAIEVKLPGRKATVKQLEFIDEVNNAGGIGFVAESLEDVLKRLDLPLRV